MKNDTKKKRCVVHSIPQSAARDTDSFSVSIHIQPPTKTIDAWQTKRPVCANIVYGNTGKMRPKWPVNTCLTEIGVGKRMAIQEQSRNEMKNEENLKTTVRSNDERKKLSMQTTATLALFLILANFFFFWEDVRTMKCGFDSFFVD